MSAFHSPPDVPWEGSPATSYKYDEATDRFVPSSYRPHYHQDERGFWHACYHKCPSWLKIILVSAAMNLFWEFVTFWPIHHFYSYMHWIR